MDWKNLISDLQSIGWTQARIAKAMGDKPQSWVADIRKGRYRDLKWSDGERLIKLHRKELRRADATTAEGARTP
ncbi:hypothetical protein [Achromobacter denitrificans]|uniref:hypothetical protein n=1 Tax=Achromobacter denitrificans TaxID=32002 RepID=UPI0024302CC7|nr:hypothetical protein [Achromobacter denitrificans]MBV2160224.1 hypothetical protein [Achromobacter denitrificans]